MNKNEDLQSVFPDWLTKDHKVMEPVFCQSLLREHPMRCIQGWFYTMDGSVTDETSLKKEIYDQISPWLESKIAKKVDELLNALRMAAYSEPIALEYDRIHVANGTLFVDGSFSQEKAYCNNRLTVSYCPDAPPPEKWMRFLSELLYPEDIITLQEYLGYCLLPTTKGQKMLMLIGKGGEGKSRIGLVMRSIFGDSMNTTSIQKVENNRFSRADLEGKLLMVDDDMDMSALPKTNHIKSIVTSECKMDMERKGVQSYQRQLYVRFLCFGNGALTALHDRSDGFFRRQIILTVRDKPPNRKDASFLVEKMIVEKEGIFLWCLEGLHRLLRNDYCFTISSRAKENIAAVARQASNIIDFLSSDGYVQFKADSEASTKDLYAVYKEWCEDNAENPSSPKTFSHHLAQNASVYRLDPTNNVYIGKAKRCRGYAGIEVVGRTMCL